ncbi:hypothetical protein PHMEG_00024503 [Phytophthora megakarya]|uniref:RNase H type-1 domain-containing protein n=1 Tax=Phytophthora megakarya TaxID=4795 RepID=A0A225VEC4_9STRA|nr:hypothetical protein PHMEG_00024503 [Phytophthora megakarya]
MIDNALWGFVQPKGGCEWYAERMKLAEEAAKHQRLLDDDSDFTLTTTRTKFEADRQASSVLDPALRMTWLRLMNRTNRRYTRLASSLTRCNQKESGLTSAITKLPFPKSKKGMQYLWSRAISVEGRQFLRRGDLAATEASFATLQRKVADAPIVRHFDAKKEVHIMLYANEWALSATLMQMHDDKLHPARFCGRVIKDAEMNYRSVEKEALAFWRKKTLHVYIRFSTYGWVHKSKSLFGRAVQFAVLLSPWQLEVQPVREKDCVFTQLLQLTITNFVDLDDSLSLVTPPTKGSPSTRLDPSLLYAQLPHDYEGFVVSLDGSAKTEKNGGYGSCLRIVWKLPEWQIVIAASAYLEQTTVNMAEYSSMNHGVIAALEHGAKDLVIVGDSRLAIQQLLGVIACRKDSLMTLLNRHRELVAKLKSVRYLHVVREYNTVADSLAGEALESNVSKVVPNDHRKRSSRS